MSIQLGQISPDFTLYNTNKEQITLSSYRGKKVVLLFFPLAFTSVCTEELCGVRDNIAFYNNANATVLGVSVDSFAVLGKFKEEQGLNFDLLSDFNKETSAAFGALYEEFVLDMKGVSKRSAFVIDEDGKVVYAEVLESPKDVPNFEKINELL